MRWTAVASEMRPYQSDRGENALLRWDSACLQIVKRLKNLQRFAP